MDVLQCNFISQMLCILDGLVPFSKDVEVNATLSIAGSNEGIEARRRCHFSHSTISQFAWIILLKWFYTSPKETDQDDIIKQT